MPIDLIPKYRLRGKTIFLSASVPNARRDPTYLRSRAIEQRIHSAVIATARRVFYEGGRLVFGAHPSISPLILLTLSNYRTSEPGAARQGRSPARAETGPRVTMFQCRVFDQPDVTSQDNEALAKAPGVEVVWTDTVDAETPTPLAPGESPAPKSLTHMRERMIVETKPDAMVVIGGMGGIKEEMEIFQRVRPGHPVYLFETTGGAAARFAKPSLQTPQREITLGRANEQRGSGDVRVIDRDADDVGPRATDGSPRSVAGSRFGEGRSAKAEASPLGRSPVEPLRDSAGGMSYVPYEFFVGRIVDELANRPAKRDQG